MTLEFRLLGVVEATSAGRPLEVGHARQRSVLAVLLTEVNRPVPAAVLLDRVWGDRLPDTARDTLGSYLSRLRRTLAPAGVTLTRGNGGYTLTVPDTAVDLHRFRALCAKARTAAAPLPLLEAALALWRGEPFADLDAPGLDPLRTALAQERHTAELDRDDLLLAQGRPAELLPELITAVEATPLDERRTGQLMLALCRLGRQADALARYADLRARLAGELGIDPGPRLRELHQRILTADPALTSPTRGTPAQLPAPPRLFTGRDAELAALTVGETSVVSGIGGIGKTSLVLFWAQRHLPAFPDGQLYVDLRGFDPASPPMPPGVALRGFLDALGVLPSAVPVDEHAQAARYRSLVTGRRLLIVLDNARDSEQVLPLLPGGDTCTVVVTSRHRLDGLLATHRARPVPVAGLAESDARHLLARYLGADRLAAEPAAVTALLTRCARLPLALGIVAARAATHPDFPLAALAEELREDTTRLDALDSGELTASLRAVFTTTYHALSPAAVALAGLLAHAPGPDLGLTALPALTDEPLPATRPRLRELTALHLVQEHTPGRYRMHDLVRLFAAEHAKPDDTAHRRLIEHQLQSIAEDPDRLAVEWPNLLAAAELAARRDWLPELTALAATLPHYLDRTGRYDDAIALHTLLLDTGNRELIGPALVGLGLTHWRRGDFDTVIERFTRALAHGRELGDDLIIGRSLNGLGLSHLRRGDCAEALSWHRAALTIGRARGFRDVEGYALVGIGFAEQWFGNYESALSHHRMAVTVAGESADVELECHARNGIGIACVALGRPGEAVPQHEQVLAVARQRENRYLQGHALVCLGLARHCAGDLDAALPPVHQGLALAVEIGEQYQQTRAHQVLAALHQDRGEPDQAAHHERLMLELRTALGLPEFRALFPPRG
ncbi:MULTISPECIES: BTAD domain-containing putative transcriptional regulator [unclassified Crossiella]|uniref:AfsR/SARP family transcriptional regulator n=1 Tax=unclassified Crossiella TaxID=2620835 RepID=UPI001FFE772F|nr:MULTISPECIES: BTAD domain-containing putative transcriptional regulator [unclassified Crossiella]MCK2244850.1 tetratricopeptide repeat protein [Crossiella sp. S99.2]MCK2258597.1 tetratricopeptide repeat protein [Crossiella sp. S99.1]